MTDHDTTCSLCGAPLLIGDYCPRCGRDAEPCSKCNGDRVYCWTCGERENACECEPEAQNLGDCNECEDSDE